MQYDRDSSHDNIVIFSAKENLELMEKYNTQFIDEVLFNTFHSNVHNTCSDNQFVNTYYLRFITEKITKNICTPNLIMTDFKMASINAFK